MTLRKVKNVRQRAAWHQRERRRRSKACGQVAALGGGPGCWPWRSRKQPREPFFPTWLPLLISGRPWLIAGAEPQMLCAAVTLAQGKHSALNATWWAPQCSLALPFPVERGKHTVQKNAVGFPRALGMFSAWLTAGQEPTLIPKFMALFPDSLAWRSVFPRREGKLAFLLNQICRFINGFILGTIHLLSDQGTCLCIDKLRKCSQEAVWKYSKWKQSLFI